MTAMTLDANHVQPELSRKRLIRMENHEIPYAAGRIASL